MLTRFRIPVLALASALAIAAPTMTLAADRNDHRGGRDFDHRVVVRGRDRGGFNLGLGFYAAPVPVPAPAAAGYYDQFGVWHSYGFYDQFGVWHSY